MNVLVGPAIFLATAYHAATAVSGWKWVMAPRRVRMRDFLPCLAWNINNVVQSSGYKPEKAEEGQWPSSFSLPVGPADFIIEQTLRNEIPAVNRDFSRTMIYSSGIKKPRPGARPV